jgi:hypothetical protein
MSKFGIQFFFGVNLLIIHIEMKFPSSFEQRWFGFQMDSLQILGVDILLPFPNIFSFNGFLNLFSTYGNCVNLPTTFLYNFHMVLELLNFNVINSNPFQFINHIVLIIHWVNNYFGVFCWYYFWLTWYLKPIKFD